MIESDILGHEGKYDAFKVVYVERFINGAWRLDKGHIEPVRSKTGGRKVCFHWQLNGGYCNLSIYGDKCNNKKQLSGHCLYDVIKTDWLMPKTDGGA